MNKCIVISALGEKSFDSGQLERLEKAGGVTFCAQNSRIKKKRFIELVENYEVVAITRKPLKDIDEQTLSKLTKLKALAIFSTGYEWVDTKYLLGRGVKVAYLPDYSTISVAEHAIGMLLVSLRRMHLSYDYSRDLLDKAISMRGFELNGKSVGIIGYGKIGQKVHQFLKPFGAKVKFHDINSEISCLFKEDHAGLTKVLTGSDIVILCCSKIRGEGPVISDAEISRMRDGVIIINPARADLVDNSAIETAIKTRKIFTYAVDEKTDFFKDKDMENGRIIETGHTAWYSTESVKRGMNYWVDNICALCAGEKITGLHGQELTL